MAMHKRCRFVLLYIMHHAWLWKQLSNFDSDLTSEDHTTERDPSSLKLHQLFAFLQGKARPALQLAGCAMLCCAVGW
jgi:hypothetical protein